MFSFLLLLVLLSNKKPDPLSFHAHSNLSPFAMLVFSVKFEWQQKKETTPGCTTHTHLPRETRRQKQHTHTNTCTQRRFIGGWLENGWKCVNYLKIYFKSAKEIKFFSVRIKIRSMCMWLLCALISSGGCWHFFSFISKRYCGCWASVELTV